MNKASIKNIQDSFEANPEIDTLFHNEYGHCFKSTGDGLTAISRADAENLKSDDETEAAGEPADSNTETGKKGKGKGK